jgi:hypothetical protein
MTATLATTEAADVAALNAEERDRARKRMAALRTDRSNVTPVTDVGDPALDTRLALRSSGPLSSKWGSPYFLAEDFSGRSCELRAEN